MKPSAIPAMDYGFVQRVIESFIVEEAEKYHFKGAVVALSGGLDSSLVAVLAHAALKGKLTLLYMPDGENKAAAKDASAIAEMTQTPLEVYDIKAVVDQICRDRHIDCPKRRGNVLARMRMNILFDLSARDHAMVVGTSNKSELLTGYSTWFGDSAACIMPLGDLYKTQLRALASHCSLPQNIIDKAPSAELWEGQTDEKEMGIGYESLDHILYHWIDLRYSPQHLIKMGFDPAMLEKTIALSRKAIYKHKLPLICKLSERTIGLDYRLSKETMNILEV